MRILVLGSILLGSLALWSFARASSGSDSPSGAGDYVVHEWGTFTSMQGSDGLTLAGLQHEEEALPDFVYSRSEVRDCPLRELGYKGLEVEVVGVTEKMETPVTYFYAKTPQRVRARVGFRNGLLTQWYPVVDLLGPPEAGPDDGPLDMSTVERSFLEWDVHVLPPGQGLSEIPEVGRDDPWSFARLPDSNVLRTAERTGDRLGPVEHEKFLFYRGLGRFDPVLRAQTSRNASIALTNTCDEPIRHVFLLHVRDGRGEFSYFPAIQPHGTLKAKRPVGPDSPSIDDMVAALIPKLQAGLVDAGLYPDEALAMALTWKRSYFYTEGLRVLYIVPRSVTDALLPLELDPQPKELVRVLVGRLECITPETEAEVEAALRQVVSADELERDAGMERLARLGRFLEPHVRRVLAMTEDETVREAGRMFLPDSD
ncbi:MAG: hypothetical protein O7B99_01745 [Planctomycetota bacterium]|nr:hypothetical protein [Planctomycetota bacterium]